MVIPKRLQKLTILSIFTISLIYIFVIKSKSRNSLIYINQQRQHDSLLPKSSSLTSSSFDLFPVNDAYQDLLKNVAFDTKSIRYIPAETIMQNYNSMLIEKPELINWDKFAYVFYATNYNNLIPILINVKQLVKLKTRAKIQLLCSFDYSNDKEAKKLIHLLSIKYNVNVKNVEMIKSTFEKDSKTWSESFTKLHSFNLVEYDRVLYLDADSIILKTMDQLFLLPPALLSLPLNYLDFKDYLNFKAVDPKSLNLIDLDNDEDSLPTPFEYSLIVQDLYKKKIEDELDFNSEYFNSIYDLLPSIEFSIDRFPNLKLASYVMLVIPDSNVFQWILNNIKNKKANEFDMEIINNVWNLNDIDNNNYYIRKNIQNKDDATNTFLKSEILPSLLVLPHYPYGLLSGEFRHSIFEHQAYLTSPADLSYLSSKSPTLNVQRILKDGKNYKNIEDILDVYPEVPYWDWSWRFNYEGNAIDIEELSLLDIGDDQFDKNDRNEEIGPGMAIERFGWDSTKILENACYIHWSDWPLDKPWLLNENSDWLVEKLKKESLTKCNSQITEIFDSLLTNFDFRKKKYENELKFATRTCLESITTWEKIYRDYKSLLKSINKELSN